MIGFPEEEGRQRRLQHGQKTTASGSRSEPMASYACRVCVIALIARRGDATGLSSFDEME